MFDERRMNPLLPERIETFINRHWALSDLKAADRSWACYIDAELLSGPKERQRRKNPFNLTCFSVFVPNRTSRNGKRSLSRFVNSPKWEKKTFSLFHSVDSVKSNFLLHSLHSLFRVLFFRQLYIISPSFPMTYKMLRIHSHTHTQNTHKNMKAAQTQQQPQQ